MRAYSIRELSRQDVQRLKDYLSSQGYGGPIEDIYWFDVPTQHLSSTQQQHLQECGPFVFALETGNTWINLELLVRPRNSLRCSCFQYADMQQMSFVIQHLENILQELDIST